MWGFLALSSRLYFCIADTVLKLLYLKIYYILIHTQIEVRLLTIISRGVREYFEECKNRE